MEGIVKNIKDSASGLFGLIFMIYIVGAQLSVAAFTYQDIKKNDSVLRYIFVSPIVGLVKAPVWPYFAYTSMFNKDSDKISNKNVDAFFQAMEGLNKTAKLTGDFAISSNPKNEAYKIAYWVNVTNDILKNCDEKELEDIYPGWGKSTAFLKAGVHLAATGSERETPGVTKQKDDLLNRFQIWLQANYAPMGKALKKYKIAPLPKSLEEKESEASNKYVSGNEVII